MSGVAGVLLAAGRGTRFGGNKLQADLAGQPLAHHAARTMGALGLSRLFAVMAIGSPPPGFQAVMNGDPQAGQGRSLSLGVRAAQTAGAEAVLVLLGDMPLVSIDHARRVLDCWDGPTTLAASEVGGRRCPPALFGSAWYDMLQAINGDEGARLLLGRAKAVAASADELMDVDQPADLVTALDRLKTRENEERG